MTYNLSIMYVYSTAKLNHQDWCTLNPGIADTLYSVNWTEQNSPIHIYEYSRKPTSQSGQAYYLHMFKYTLYRIFQ